MPPCRQAAECAPLQGRQSSSMSRLASLSAPARVIDVWVCVHGRYWRGWGRWVGGGGGGGGRGGRGGTDAGDTKQGMPRAASAVVTGAGRQAQGRESVLQRRGTHAHLLVPLLTVWGHVWVRHRRVPVRGACGGGACDSLDARLAAGGRTRVRGGARHGCARQCACRARLHGGACAGDRAIAWV